MSDIRLETGERRSARHSGLELLRLVAMYFIVALHVNFYAYGGPTVAELQTSPWGGSARVFLESLSIVGVNAFILISGWFGIRPKLKRVSELLFQCVFFCVVLYAFGVISGIPFAVKEAIKNLFLVGNLNWFIKSYLVLYIFAPVLEDFAERASKRTFALVLAAFFGFQTIYGWLFPVAAFFCKGYSAVSFMGLYLLARYVRRFSPKFAMASQLTDVSVYGVLSLVTTGAYVVCTWYNIPLRNWFAYSSPLVIAAALYLFLFFAKFEFKAGIVDSAARSCYAVYLFHIHPCVFASLLLPVVSFMVARPALIWMIPFFLWGGVFVPAILLDKLRIWVWNRIIKRAA